MFSGAFSEVLSGVFLWGVVLCDVPWDVSWGDPWGVL